MQFIQSYNQFKDFLNESLKHTTGIKQSQVEPTINHIKEHLASILRLDEDSMAFLGSAGKRDPKVLSTNINVALAHKKLLESNRVEKEDLFEFLESQIKRLGYESQMDDKKNRLNISWPIEGDEKKGFIDLHVKLSDNLDWLKFSRYSPMEGEESKYHSKYRQVLFEAIAETIKTDILEYFDTKKNVKEYEQYMLDVEEGLHTISKSFAGKHGKLKRALPLEETKKLITADPKAFVKELFGNDTKPEDVMTLENCMEILKSDNFVHKKKRKRILDVYKNKLVGARLVFPEGLM